MPATKRKSDGAVEVPTKRVKTNSVAPNGVHYTKEELNDMSKDELITYALQLQAQIAAIPKPKELSKEEIAEKARKARDMMIKGIEKPLWYLPDEGR
jgi:CxxC motif-containing protein